MSNKRLIKSTGLLSFATLCSRALGFVRDILIANFFGTTIFAEAFVVAFRIPNMFRDLIGEGAANAAFVPVLTDYHSTRPAEEFWRLARNLLYMLSLALLVISVLGIIFAPAIVRLIAPGFINNPEKLAITINLTRLMFPFIFLVGLMAYGMGVLNSLDDFAAAAFGPALLNIAMITFLVFACPKIGILGLAMAVLAGGVLQIAPMAFELWRKGLHLAPISFTIHPAIKKIWKLLIPRFFGSAVYQMSVIVDNIFSTFEWIVGVGAPAALWYSYRLFHLPLAIFGIALATAALPRMSREVAKNNIPKLRETISFSLRIVFFVLVPAGIGLATLGGPIIRILFQRGEFTAYSTFITDKALFFYSFGLFACGGIKILVNSFFSLGDTKTPVKVASVSFFLNAGLNYALMWPLKIGGLALATSAAATFNFIALYILLTRKIGDMGTSKIAGSFFRVLLAGAGMGIFSYFAGKMSEKFYGNTFYSILWMLLVIISSASLYILLALVFKAVEIKKIKEWISKKD